MLDIGSNTMGRRASKFNGLTEDGRPCIQDRSPHALEVKFGTLQQGLLSTTHTCRLDGAAVMTSAMSVGEIPGNDFNRRLRLQLQYLIHSDTILAIVVDIPTTLLTGSQVFRGGAGHHPGCLVPAHVKW